MLRRIATLDNSVLRLLHSVAPCLRLTAPLLVIYLRLRLLDRRTQRHAEAVVEGA